MLKKYSSTAKHFNNSSKKERKIHIRSLQIICLCLDTLEIYIFLD